MTSLEYKTQVDQSEPLNRENSELGKSVDKRLEEISAVTLPMESIQF